MCGSLQCYCKVSCKKLRNYISEIRFYAIFSYICTPKPMGRKDPSRHERVKRANVSMFIYVYSSLFVGDFCVLTAALLLKLDPFKFGHVSYYFFYDELFRLGIFFLWRSETYPSFTFDAVISRIYCAYQDYAEIFFHNIFLTIILG